MADTVTMVDESGRAEQLDVSDVASLVDERRLAEISTILDRTGVPKEGVTGELDVVQRVSILAAWSHAKRRR